MKSYELLERYGLDLKQATIVDIFQLEVVPFEGGLTVIFRKDEQNGIVIFCYTELGIWVEYYQHGKTKVVDLESFYHDNDYYNDAVNAIKNLLFEYDIK